MGIVMNRDAMLRHRSVKLGIGVVGTRIALQGHCSEAYSIGMV